LSNDGANATAAGHHANADSSSPWCSRRSSIVRLTGLSWYGLVTSVSGAYYNVSSRDYYACAYHHSIANHHYVYHPMSDSGTNNANGRGAYDASASHNSTTTATTCT
jgi:hypothetical protein